MVIHKPTKLAILALMPTLYSHTFALFSFIFTVCKAVHGMMMKNLGGGRVEMGCSLKSANHSAYFSLLLPFVITSHQEMCGVD